MLFTVSSDSTLSKEDMVRIVRELTGAMAAVALLGPVVVVTTVRVIL